MDYFFMVVRHSKTMFDLYEIFHHGDKLSNHTAANVYYFATMIYRLKHWDCDRVRQYTNLTHGEINIDLESLSTQSMNNSI